MIPLCAADPARVIYPKEKEKVGTPNLPECLLRNVNNQTVPSLNRQFISSEHNHGCVTIRDIVGGPVVPAWAILMNFQFDAEWLITECPVLLDVSKVVCIHGQDDISNSPAKPSHWELHKPPVPRYGTHHSKAMLLGYEDGVRVAVFTANFGVMDHNVLSNACWTQDFPKKSNRSPVTSEFEEDIVRYMHATRWRKNNPSSLPNNETLRKYDYSGAGAKLIASVPGTYTGDDKWLWGQGAMREALKRETFPRRFQSGPIVCQYSSTGFTTEKWLGQLQESFSCGDVEVEEVGGVGGDGGGGGNGGGGGGGCGSNNKLGIGPLQLVWPTVEEVRTSVIGYSAGGCFPGNKKNVIQPCILSRLHKWRRSVAMVKKKREEEEKESAAAVAAAGGSGSGSGGEGEEPHTLPNPMGRERVAGHIKTFLRYAQESEGEGSASGGGGGTKLAWILVTSHNLSKAAWGEFQSNDGQLHIRSYELGVLLLPSLVGEKVSKPFSCGGGSRIDVAAAASRRTCLAGVRPRPGTAGGSHHQVATTTEFRCAHTLAPGPNGVGLPVGATGADADLAAAIAASRAKAEEEDDADLAIAIAASLADVEGGAAAVNSHSGRVGAGDQQVIAEEETAKEEEEVEEADDSEDVVIGLAPLPYHVPPQPYATSVDGGGAGGVLGGSDVPWMWDKDHTKPDVGGRTWIGIKNT